jgi:hypothetical protein
MRAYLPAAALGAAFIAWLLSGTGREGASEARDAVPDLDLRKAMTEAAEANVKRPVEAANPPDVEPAQRRPVRIVYPSPFEAR